MKQIFLLATLFICIKANSQSKDSVIIYNDYQRLPLKMVIDSVGKRKGNTIELFCHSNLWLYRGRGLANPNIQVGDTAVLMPGNKRSYWHPYLKITKHKL